MISGDDAEAPINLRTCPVAMVGPGEDLLLRIHRFWQMGVMPITGGLLDQPNWVVEGMAIIDAQLARCPKEGDE